MKENKYTSLALSKKLAESGCKLKSEVYITGNSEYRVIKEFNIMDLDDDEFFDLVCNNYNRVQTNYNYYVYDILNDICCKYAKEFFGEEKVCVECGKSYDEWGKVNHCEYCRRCKHDDTRYEFLSKNILKLMQQGKKKEAEDYIWENCLFNKEDKK